MKKLTNLQQYIPNEDELAFGENVVYLKSDEGEDWYSSLGMFSGDTIKIAFDIKGIICSMSKDVTLIWPVGLSVTEIDESKIPAGCDAEGGWVFEDGIIKERTYSQEDIVKSTERRKTECLRHATAAIAPLQDAIDMGVATHDEEAKLKEWKLYRIDVNRIDTSLVDVVWPEPPDASLTM